MPATGLTVIIITNNEEKRIGATLEAARKVADEIIIADIGSTDNTRQIALLHNAKFYPHEWQGYGAQRNFAAGKATNNFILALDADEVLSNELINSINDEKAKGFPKELYSLNRLNNYYGAFVHHGLGYPDEPVRLYNRHNCKWNLRKVHETLDTNGAKPALLSGKLLHYTTDSISEHIRKADAYTTLSAHQYFAEGKPDPGFTKMVLSPAMRFIKSYFLKQGFLDGWHGYILARMHAKNVFDKYAKLKLLHKAAKAKQ